MTTSPRETAQHIEATFDDPRSAAAAARASASPPPRTGSTTSRPRKNGTQATRTASVTTMPQPSMTTGLAATVLTLVIMAVTKSASRSSRNGMAITVTENRTSARAAPTT